MSSIMSGGHIDYLMTGSKVRHERIALNLSVHYVADYLDMSDNVYQAYEENWNTFSDEEIRKLEELFLVKL